MGLFTNKSKELVPVISWSAPSAIGQVASIASSGRVFAGSGDTVLGLFAPVTHEGFEALNNLKGRSEKPYLVLISDYEKIFELSDDGQKPHVEKLIKRYWPGPLTIIVNAKKSVPAWMKSKDNTIAVRLPNHEPLRALLRQVGPLFSTSANKAGQPVAKTIEAIDDDIKRGIVCFIKDVHEPQDLPSTIVDCSQGSCVIIRQGACHIID